MSTLEHLINVSGQVVHTHVALLVSSTVEMPISHEIFSRSLSIILPNDIVRLYLIKVYLELNK